MFWLSAMDDQFNRWNGPIRPFRLIFYLSITTVTFYFDTLN